MSFLNAVAIINRIIQTHKPTNDDTITVTILPDTKTGSLFTNQRTRVFSCINIKFIHLYANLIKVLYGGRFSKLTATRRRK
ncbi:hypothetical protein [Tortoise microvirus 7]|nr:hypothetical protein [Tortoise microvirus 7]QCS37463.1 hypothetical protein [Tortoise microvirus 105]